jgi:adenosylcobinamide-phosphate synthase
VVSVALGLVADRVLGEPPDAVHPVRAFGTVMQAVEERLHRDSRVAGTVHAGIGLALGLLAGTAVPSTALATYVAVAGRMLVDTAAGVGRALEAEDLPRARALLPSLVGRDPSGLDATGVARAVVESVAENTVDAVVAPALWGLVGGAPGVLAHRAANTMDAMVGHRSARYARYGWAAARLDDGMAWVPARATAALVAAVRPAAAADVWRAVRRDAPAHPSPNSGVAEAAYAAALGLRLGGEVRYGDRVEHRPHLGDGAPPAAGDIARAVRLTQDVAGALAAVVSLAALRPARRRR